MRVTSTHRCEVCEKVFKSFRSDSKTCSVACRSKLSRIKNGGTVKEQAQIIKTQAKVIKTISSRPVPIRSSSPDIQNLSIITGKDLTECKRPDGKHFYTDKDLWILYSLLLHSVRMEPKLITILVSGPWDDSNVLGKLILDFEQRFECKFDDVKVSNPNIKFSQAMDVTANYPNLNYSR
jgi:hypothetical protein